LLTVRAVKEFLDGELAKCNNYEEFRSNKGIRPNFPEIDSETAFRSIKAKGTGQTTILKFLGPPWKQWMVQLTPILDISPYERAELALKLKDIIAEKAKEKQREGGKKKVLQISGEPPIRTGKELAKIAGISHDTTSKVELMLPLFFFLTRI